MGFGETDPYKKPEVKSRGTVLLSPYTIQKTGTSTLVILCTFFMTFAAAV
jgi:hypothetical protein